MGKRKLYFSCALTGLSNDHREVMITFRNTLTQYFEIFEFCPPETSPREIYRHDIHTCVAKCGLMLAICND